MNYNTSSSSLGRKVFNEKSITFVWRWDALDDFFLFKSKKFFQVINRALLERDKDKISLRQTEKAICLKIYYYWWLFMFHNNKCVESSWLNFLHTFPTPHSRKIVKIKLNKFHIEMDYCEDSLHHLSAT